METSENLPEVKNGFSVQKFTEISQAAPGILEANQLLRSKAEAIYETQSKLPVDDPAADTMRKDFIESCKKAKVRMKDRRAPFTQMVDAVKKLFTAEEAWLDEKIVQTQDTRNKYAALQLDKQKKAQEAAQRELDKKNNLAHLRQIFITKLVDLENNAITTHQQTVGEYLKILTVANINSAKPLEDNPVLLPAGIEDILINYASAEMTPYQKTLVTDAEINEIAVELASTFNDTRVMDECIRINERCKNDLPSLKKKLQEIEKAKDEKAKQLLKDQIAEKIADDTKQVAEETNKAEVDAGQAAATQSGAKQIQNQLEFSVITPTLDVKKSKKIFILNKEGYTNIFAMWFEREGKDQTDAKIQNVTIARMVAFCEKMADMGILISSPHISYQDKVVAK